MRVLIIILARKNSKRLKNKNLLKLKSIPLFMNTIYFAKKLRNIHDVLFSSDSNKMLNLAKKECKILNRPTNLSNSKSKSSQACLHAANYYEKKFCKIDAVLLLQPTTPFRKISDVNKAIQTFKKKKKSVISVSQINNQKKINNLYYISKGLLKKIKYKDKEIKIKYTPNGSFYLTSLKYLKKFRDFQRDGAIPYIIKSNKYKIDIDLKKDLTIARKYLYKEN